MELKSQLDARQAPDATLSPHAAAILRAVRHDIDQVLAPEVTSSMAQMIARMASDAITSLLGREDYVPALRADYVRNRLSALASILSVGRVTAALSPAQLEAGQACIEAARAEPDSEQVRRTVDSVLAQLATPVMRAGYASTDAQVRSSLETALRGVFGTASTMQTRVQEEMAREIADDAAWHDRMRATVTPERLQAYWRARFPDRPDATVTTLRELPGGFGKTTILFEIDGWEDQPSALVMRRDVLGGATEASVVDEFPILQVAFRHGVPLPEPILLEADPSKLDRPFIIVRRVEGDPAGSLWQVSPQCTAQTGRDLAQAIARLHAIDLDDFGRKPTVSAAEHMRSYLGYFRSAVQRKQPEPDPAMDMALCWLEENMPAPPERLSWVHADTGFWNILQKDGRITALLDWELGHPGDPAEDISSMKSSIETFMPWEDFLAAYRDAGGAPYREDLGEYYAIWRDVRNAIFSDFADHAFWCGANPELRMVHCGMVSSKRLLQRALDRIATHGLHLKLD